VSIAIFSLSADCRKKQPTYENTVRHLVEHPNHEKKELEKNSSETLCSRKQIKNDQTSATTALLL
jgi:hypothetical protein